MAMAVKYPVGMQSFPEIREEGFVYVDKTQYIPKLKRVGKYFFLGRPRRFGKSLFLSMLHAYYQGRRELFEGLYISEYENDWQVYPVIHLDFTGRDYTDSDSLRSAISTMLEPYEREYGNEIYADRRVDERFERLIRAAYEKTGKKVVILVDEYDKAILDTVDDHDLQDKCRNILRGVYGNFKRMDSYIRFGMFTGVTRFGKLSIFSDLNNLNDISMDEEFSGLCGVTTEELTTYFKTGVEELAQRHDISEEEAYKRLRENYDGYHFSPERSPDIYNPYSLLCALSKKKIGSYWFSTGTPSFLVKLIKTRKLSLKNIEDTYELADSIQNVSFDLVMSLGAVLYQSGYLTIKGYNSVTNMLHLGFPNKEVEKGFLLQLMSIYINKPETTSWSDITRFWEDISEGRTEAFMQRLQSMFADFNQEGFQFINLEQHYQDICYLIFKLMGCLTHIEYKTATGRIDLVITSSDIIYVFEFKRNGSAEEALEQIDSNHYLLPFKADGRRLIKIGATFSDEIKGLKSWIIED